MGKIVITEIYGKTLLFLFDDQFELKAIRALAFSDVDTVYLGRIDEINKGLNAAFISVMKNKKVYVSLDEITFAGLKCGDSVLVQIKTDALKSKLPTGSLSVCIAGEYSVIHMGGKGIHFSKKLSSAEVNSITDVLEKSGFTGSDDYGIVVRTNASYLEPGQVKTLTNEIDSLLEIVSRIKTKGETSKVHTLIYKDSNKVLHEILKLNTDEFDDIITDDCEIYDNLKEADVLKKKNLKLYADEGVSLSNLYSLKTHLDRALDPKVYLDCGGYLLIENTEAFTVIDVNSGKLPGKNKDRESYYARVNKEAAKEVARQISLRNISGMILVDFINMSKDENNDKLMNMLNDLVSKDKIQTKVIDMTKLGIVEITRKKVDNPLDKIISL
ncbi:MAG: ribonuclease E/G [Lachnospiraceae bacterium]|nr:ribonuclease E/G [Lachnospiraceae bacterium]